MIVSKYELHYKGFETKPEALDLAIQNLLDHFGSDHESAALLLNNFLHNQKLDKLESDMLEKKTKELFTKLSGTDPFLFK